MERCTYYVGARVSLHIYRRLAGAIAVIPCYSKTDVPSHNVMVFYFSCMYMSSLRDIFVMNNNNSAFCIDIVVYMLLTSLSGIICSLLICHLRMASELI